MAKTTVKTIVSVKRVGNIKIAKTQVSTGHTTRTTVTVLRNR